MSNLKTEFEALLASEISSQDTKQQTLNTLKTTNSGNNLGGKIIPHKTRFSKVRFTRKSGAASQGLKFREIFIYVTNPDKPEAQFSGGPAFLNYKNDTGIRDSDFTYYPSNTQVGTNHPKQAMDLAMKKLADAGAGAEYWQVDLNNHRGKKGEIYLADLELISILNATGNDGNKAIGCAIELVDKNDNVVFTSPVITENTLSYKIHGPQFGNMINIKFDSSRYKQFTNSYLYHNTNEPQMHGVLAKMHSSKNMIVNHASGHSSYVRNYVIEGGVNYALGDTVAINRRYRNWSKTWYDGTITSLSPLKLTIPNDGEYDAKPNELCLITRGSGSARKSFSPSNPPKLQTRSTEVLNLKDDFLNELKNFESSKSGVDSKIAEAQQFGIDRAKVKLTGDLKYNKIKLVWSSSAPASRKNAIYNCLVSGCGGTRSSMTGGLAKFGRGLKKDLGWEVNAGGSDVHSLRDLELLRIERDESNDSSYTSLSDKEEDMQNLWGCKIQFLLDSTVVFTTDAIDMPTYSESLSIELRGPCFDHMVEGKTNNRKSKYDLYKAGKNNSGSDAKVSLQFQLMFEYNEVFRDKHHQANDFQTNYILARERDHRWNGYVKGDIVAAYHQTEGKFKVGVVDVRLIDYIGEIRYHIIWEDGSGKGFSVRPEEMRIIDSASRTANITRGVQQIHDPYPQNSLISEILKLL